MPSEVRMNVGFQPLISPEIIASSVWSGVALASM
jgi:hypothetical protein